MFHVTREHHHSIPSTQDRAKEIARSLTTPCWFLVTADEQTAGRGTRGKHWKSPPHVNIYATFLFPFPTDKINLLIHIPQVMAYSVLQTLDHYGLEAKFKWVNDIFIHKKKTCGILCESDSTLSLPGYHMVCAATGINVNLDKAFCDSLDQPTTSLMLELGQPVNREELLEHLKKHIFDNIHKLIQKGFQPFVQSISEKMEFIGESIKIQLNDNANTLKEGTLVGINPEGMLLLQTNQGLEKLFTGSIIRNSDVF